MAIKTIRIDVTSCLYLCYGSKMIENLSSLEAAFLVYVALVNCTPKVCLVVVFFGEVRFGYCAHSLWLQLSWFNVLFSGKGNDVLVLAGVFWWLITKGLK